MITYHEAELMHLQPLEALGSLSSLACVGCFDNCSSAKGLGDIGGDAWQSWYCQGFLAPSIFPWCVPPTPDVAVLDTSVFGSQMTQANKDAATSMAQELVRNDPNLKPDDSNINWWIVGGAILVGAMILKRI